MFPDVYRRTRFQASKQVLLDVLCVAEAKNVRFAFIKKGNALLQGSPYKFKKHGKCGMELSQLLPHLLE